MSKLNRNQIEATLRNKIASQYTERIKSFCMIIDEYKAQNDKLYKSNYYLKQENEELKDKINQYEDWINRLQDFCNMNEHDREIHIQELREKTKLNELMKSVGFYKTINHIMSLL